MTAMDYYLFEVLPDSPFLLPSLTAFLSKSTLLSLFTLTLEHKHADSTLAPALSYLLSSLPTHSSRDSIYQQPSFTELLTLVEQ